MTPLLVVLLASGSCVYWTQGVDTRQVLATAGVTRICVPPEHLEAWKAAGLPASPLARPDLAAREMLPTPGVTPRAGVASPTRAPWVVANGWRISRNPSAKYAYTVPAGKAALATAEAFGYGADAVLAIDPADLATAGSMIAFLDSVPPVDLPPIADLAVVDDGSPVTGEVMNLLARRNLLVQPVQSRSDRFPITIVVGSPEYPAEEAADPSAFAQKVRARLTDERRSLRIYGSEVVVGRLTGTPGRLRLHLLNYGGREIEGLRIRVKGDYPTAEAYVAGSGQVSPTDRVLTEGATEVSLPRLATYAVIDFTTGAGR
jgi:hypothetical protein